MAACGLPRVAAVLHAAAPALSRPLPPPSANTVAPGLPGVPLAVASERRTGTADGSADKCATCRQPARREAPHGPPAVAATALTALGSAALVRAASLTD